MSSSDSEYTEVCAMQHISCNNNNMIIIIVKLKPTTRHKTEYTELRPALHFCCCCGCTPLPSICVVCANVAMYKDPESRSLVEWVSRLSFKQPLQIETPKCKGRVTVQYGNTVKPMIIKAQKGEFLYENVKIFACHQKIAPLSWSLVNIFLNYL